MTTTSALRKGPDVLASLLVPVALLLLIGTFNESTHLLGRGGLSWYWSVVVFGSGFYFLIRAFRWWTPAVLLLYLPVLVRVLGSTACWLSSLFGGP